MAADDRDRVNELLAGDSFLTAGEVAALFRVDRRVVNRWGAEGKLPGQKSPGGRGWLFRRSVVTAALNRGRVDRG